MSAIAFARVSCAAGGRLLLADLDLVVPAGERIALVGHNGAGKSTLLRLISGFAFATEGRVEVLGRLMQREVDAPALRSMRAEVGQVFQGLHLVQRLSALDNVLIGALPRVGGWRSWARIFPKDTVARAREALAAVGLVGRSDVRADRLSGGERQKVAIARMLMQRPRLILADEPTAALDPYAAAEIAELLSRVARDQGATLITVVHAPSLLPVLADRVVGLRRGRLVLDARVDRGGDAQLTRLYGDDASMRPSNLAFLGGRR